MTYKTFKDKINKYKNFSDFTEEEYNENNNLDVVTSYIFKRYNRMEDIR